MADIGERQETGLDEGEEFSQNSSWSESPDLQFTRFMEL